MPVADFLIVPGLGLGSLVSLLIQSSFIEVVGQMTVRMS